MSTEFWHQVDTAPRFYRRPCDCARGKGQHCFPNCASRTEWENERVGCLGQSGSGDRCGKLTGRGLPFCDFHEKNAIYAIADALAEDAENHALYGGWHPVLRYVARLLSRTDDQRVFKSLPKREVRRFLEWLAIDDLAPSAQQPKRRELTLVRRCALYRHYDADGLLLYVGISIDPEARQKAHRDGANWWRFSTTCDTDWYLTESDAATAERKAIVHEAPIFNRSAANTERNARAIRYLVDHDALDLLRETA